MFVLDAFREPWSLIPVVMRAYWRAGFRRWLATYRHHFADIAAGPATLPDHHAIVGEHDPIPDRDCLSDSSLTPTVVPGAHACHFSNPAAVAEVVTELMRSAADARSQ